MSSAPVRVPSVYSSAQQACLEGVSQVLAGIDLAGVVDAGRIGDAFQSLVVNGLISDPATASSRTLSSHLLTVQEIYGENSNSTQTKGEYGCSTYSKSEKLTPKLFLYSHYSNFKLTKPSFTSNGISQTNNPITTNTQTENSHLSFK